MLLFYASKKSETRPWIDATFLELSLSKRAKNVVDIANIE
jgi:hypothetical protein